MYYIYSEMNSPSIHFLAHFSIFDVPVERHLACDEWMDITERKAMQS